MKFTKNIGTSDRIVRLVTALILLGIAYWKSSWIVFGVAAFIFLEACFSWCIMYQILGKNSCSCKTKK